MTVLTLPEAKLHLNIAAATTTYDDELTATIAAAEAVITQRVGPLEPTTITTRITAAGSELALPVTPVISLTTVTNSGGSSLDAGLFFTDPDAGLVTYLSGTAFGSTAYTVVYQAGRATCPPDLLLAVKELVRHLWESQRSAARFPGMGDDEPAPAAGYLLPYRVQELIAPHVQIPVG